MSEWMTWSNVAFFNNTLKEYAVALFTVIGLVLVCLLSKKLIIGHLRRLAARTVGDFDDFVVGLLAQIGAPRCM